MKCAAAALLVSVANALPPQHAHTLSHGVRHRDRHTASRGLESKIDHLEDEFAAILHRLDGDVPRHSHKNSKIHSRFRFPALLPPAPFARSAVVRSDATWRSCT